MGWAIVRYEYEVFGQYESVDVVFTDGVDVIEIMADVEIHGNVVALSDCHVAGAAANRVGSRKLLDLVRWVKRELGIDELRIARAIRTSGASPGRRPRPLVF